jgi:hypothetical protein
VNRPPIEKIINGIYTDESVCWLAQYAKWMEQVLSESDDPKKCWEREVGRGREKLDKGGKK